MTDISGGMFLFGVEDVREKMMSRLPPSVIGEGDVEREAHQARFAFKLSTISIGRSTDLFPIVTRYRHP